MKSPKSLDLSDSYVRFIAERGGIITIFNGVPVIG